MKLNAVCREDWLTDWPSHYYELKPEERLAALKEQLRSHPDSRADQRRLELFHKRFTDTFADRFLYAWMMLKTADNAPAGWLLRKQAERDIKKEIRALCADSSEPDELLLEEWKDFSDTLIRTCLTSSSYRSAVFGMGSVGDRNVCMRLANEIETVTETVPGRVHAEGLLAPLRAILLDRFIKLVPDGETILREVQSR